MKLAYSLDRDHVDRKAATPSGGRWDESQAIICPSCNLVIREESKSEVVLEIYDTNASYWPDVLGPSMGPRGKIVSGGMLDDWDRNGVPYGDTCATRLKGLFPRKLNPREAPNFFYVYPDFGVQLDYDSPIFGEKRKCEACGQTRADHLEPSTFAFIEESWNGNDLVRVEEEPFYIFCTQRIVDIATQNCRKGIYFQPTTW